MATYRPVRVFTEMQSCTKKASPHKIFADENRDRIDKLGLSPGDRQIRVTAIGEVSQPPDQCRYTVRVSSKKDNAQDAKNSVSRRLDYVIQCLQNHGLKDQDFHVHKHLSRCDSLYVMDSEVGVQFGDIKKAEKIANLLVEKLDDTVSITVPDYFHTNHSMESLRKQSSLVAIHNAKQKAQEMARFVHLSVGKPLYINEEESREAEGQIDSQTDPAAGTTIQERIANATMSVRSQVFVCFELRPKQKKVVQ